MAFKSCNTRKTNNSKNYRPNLVLLGHNNSLTRSTLISLKKQYNCKIALWYEDHVIKGDPSYRKNLDLIEKNCDLIDNYFSSGKITEKPTKSEDGLTITWTTTFNSEDEFNDFVKEEVSKTNSRTRESHCSDNSISYSLESE